MQESALQEKSQSFCELQTVTRRNTFFLPRFCKTASLYTGIIIDIIIIDTIIIENKC